MATVTQLYLEKCRSKLSARIGKEATDYQLAKLLDISTSAMSRYIKHDREADDDAAFKIAQFAQVPPMEIIGAIHAKKSKNEETKTFWEKAAKGAVAGFGAVALGGALLAQPTPAEASKPHLNLTNNSDNLYIIRTWIIVYWGLFRTGSLFALSGLFSTRKGQFNGIYA